ncbi:hypothetical protein [Pontibacter cellulosilyticus]|uniref:Lipoprotein n=1 Tax=Pontibacter cellulosilyticus TaxID=1720253 RepID=A0A923SLK5_9BACT|nr:hypothetical protein [Pontibacter cellulosilyticus]MBC5994976.1 hypothetical protein [Pontibacter cellulosilyticus]
MKKFTIYALAPALALFALGCSGPSAMQSTEYDDMYYSSSDKTTYAEPEARSYDGLTETDNREQQRYSESSNAVTDNYYAEDYEYYDGREYNPRNNWYRPNYSYVDPYWGSAYTPRHYAYSRYNSPFYDPFYDPFYHDPFFYDPFYRRPFWNSGVSVIISYNYGWGNWGRHHPYYSRWYPHNPYYHHGYYSGFYGNNWYGNRWVYDSPIIVNRIKTQYGPRDARGGVVTDGNRGNGGRPVRGEAYQGDVIGTENARPSRSSDAVAAPQTGSEAKPSIPSRPSRTEYYDPSQGRSRGTRERGNINEQRQQNERRVIQPSERRSREYTPTPRSTESRPRTREYNMPQQRQRSTESRPSYEPRRESSQPSRSSEVRRESSSSNSSSGSNNSGSGRPKRGQ